MKRDRHFPEINSPRILQTLIVFVVALTFIVGQVAPAEAATLAEALTDRNYVSGFSNSFDDSSYDGKGYDAFKPFSSLTSGQVFSVSSFSGLAAGSSLQATMISNVAAFDGSAPAYADNFGVIDSSGNFVSLLDSVLVDPAASSDLYQTSDEELTLALKSPEGLFSSVDNDNSDDKAHILAQVVTTDSELELSNTSLNSTGSLRFSFLAGDIILFIEDMLSDGNQQYLGVPIASDFDYNDMVVVIRQVNVPEPSSLILLGIGFLAIGSRRRKSY